MTLPNSGPLSLAQITAEFALGTSLSAYRGVQWWTDAGATGVFPSAPASIGIFDFYGKRVSSPVSPGSVDFTSPGVYNFTVPSFNSMVVTIWGGGGGGGAGTGSQGGLAGTGSSFLSQSAGGGGGGGNSSQPGGGGGSATGGNVNTVGNAGGVGSDFGGNGFGGNAPNGGAGGTRGQNGGFPGGGGGGRDLFGFGWGSGGGSGGYVQRTYTSGEIAVGSTVSLTVGTGGLGAVLGSGSGANGRVSISWS